MLTRCRPRFTAVGAALSTQLDSQTTNLFASLKKKAHVRYIMDTNNRTVMTKAEFDVMCQTASAIESERMTAAEGQQYLQSLTKAGVVLEHNGHVYLRPKHVFDDMLRHGGVQQSFNTEHPEEQFAREEAAAKLDSHMEAARRGTTKNALWRRRFWAGVALASGTQMLGLSYLTFIVYGWDVMEPICYFVTAGTALVSYLYFLVKNKDHTYQSFDSDVLFNEQAHNEDVHTVKLHADNVSRIVDTISVQKVIDEADDDLLEEMLIEASGTPRTSTSRTATQG